MGDSPRFAVTSAFSLLASLFPLSLLPCSLCLCTSTRFGGAAVLAKVKFNCFDLIYCCIHLSAHKAPTSTQRESVRSHLALQQFFFCFYCFFFLFCFLVFFCLRLPLFLAPLLRLAKPIFCLSASVYLSLCFSLCVCVF